MSLITFIVVGDRLGPSLFGLLAALLATIVLIGPLLTASPEHVAVQRIAQGTPVAQAWQRSVAILLTMGPVVAVAAVAASAIIAPAISVRAVVLITLGEVTLLGLARVAIRAHEAVGEAAVGTRVALVNLLSRGVVLGVFVFGAAPSIDTWSVLHVAASAAAAFHAHMTIPSGSSGWRFTLPTTDDYRLGLPFALNAGPDGLLSSNDRMVLSGVGLESDAGIYAAAYRIASIANVPARSVLRTRYASYFKLENQSTESSVKNALSIVRATAPAGVLSGLALLLLAPVAQWVLGDDFADSVSALRFLAFLPVVRSISTPGANVLTGTGRQKLRILGTLGAALLNLVLNLIFIPSYGWQAAVVTTLIAELALLVWIWFQVLRPGQTTAEMQSELVD